MLEHSENKKAKTEALAAAAAAASSAEAVAPCLPSSAASTVKPGGSQLAVQEPLIRAEAFDVNMMIQRMAQIQQEAIQGQLQLQQNFLEQFVRMLPGVMSGNAGGDAKGNAAPVQQTSVGVPPTEIDSLWLGAVWQSLRRLPVQ